MTAGISPVLQNSLFIGWGFKTPVDFAFSLCLRKFVKKSPPNWRGLYE